MDTTKMLKVSIVISNYNGEQLLPECLNSLHALDYPSYEVIVVDAHSTDDSCKMMSERYPWVHIIALEKKVGIGEAINRGVAAASGDIIVIDFNTDETAEPDWLNRLVEVIQNYKGDKVIVGGARLQYGSAGLVDDLGMNYIQPFGIAIKRYHGLPLKDCPKDRIEEVAYLNMIAATRSAYDELGPLDEHFYFFGEDREYCLRARRNCYKILLVPDAITWHKTSASIGKDPAAQNYHLRRSEFHLVLKYQPWYLLPFGVAGFGVLFICDLLAAIPKVYRIMPNKSFTTFSRRRTFGEVVADLKALQWNLGGIPEIIRFRLRIHTRTNSNWLAQQKAQ